MTQHVNLAEEKTTRRGVVLHKQNPFLAETRDNTNVGVRKITNKSGDKMLILNATTGETSPASFWQYQEADKTSFVKMYVDGVRGIAELSNAGTKVFTFLYDEVQKNIGKDLIYLSLNKINEFDPVSRTIYSRGLAELLNKNFLAAAIDQGWYYINPNYMWNGDRLAFVKQIRLKTTAAKTDIEKLEDLGQQRLIA